MQEQVVKYAVDAVCKNVARSNDDPDWGLPIGASQLGPSSGRGVFLHTASTAYFTTCSCPPRSRFSRRWICLGARRLGV